MSLCTLILFVFFFQSCKSAWTTAPSYEFLHSPLQTSFSFIKHLKKQVEALLFESQKNGFAYSFVVRLPFRYYGNPVPFKILQHSYSTVIVTLLWRHSSEEEWVFFFVRQIERGCAVADLRMMKKRNIKKIKDSSFRLRPLPRQMFSIYTRPDKNMKTQQ